MLVFLNGEQNFVIIPKETLEEMGNPKYVQFSTDGEGILIRYSGSHKLAEAIEIKYPLKGNSYGLHVRDEQAANAIRKRNNWDNHLYSVNAAKLLNMLVIKSGGAKKTEISNKGL